MQQTVDPSTGTAVTTTYTFDLDLGLTQVLDDGSNSYIYGVNRLAQSAIAGTFEYFVGDALGSVRQLANASGAVTLTKSYLPYGEELSRTGVSASSYGFTSEWTDASGLVYLRARYYNPWDGRFMT